MSHWAICEVHKDRGPTLEGISWWVLWLFAWCFIFERATSHVSVHALYVCTNARHLQTAWIAIDYLVAIPQLWLHFDFHICTLYIWQMYNSFLLAVWSDSGQWQLLPQCFNEHGTRVCLLVEQKGTLENWQSPSIGLQASSELVKFANKPKHKQVFRWIWKFSWVGSMVCFVQSGLRKATDVLLSFNRTQVPALQSSWKPRKYEWYFTLYLSYIPCSVTTACFPPSCSPWKLCDLFSSHVQVQKPHRLLFETTADKPQPRTGDLERSMRPWTFSSLSTSNACR